MYASIQRVGDFEPSKTLIGALGREYEAYERYFTERTGECAIDHLCRVASGMDSKIYGDDQIITQTREALELSREQKCTDSYLETIFRLAVQAAKAIKTNVILTSPGIDSVPGKAVEKLKKLCELSSRNAVVIGNGQMGRLIAEMLIRENVYVTVTLREYNKGFIKIPKYARTINYKERYKAIEQADIVVSATTSPHFTLYYHELRPLPRLPEIIVDLAVPRDVEPSVQNIPDVTVLTIDDISGEKRILPPERISLIDKIISEHIDKYNRWLIYKESAVILGGNV